MRYLLFFLCSQLCAEIVSVEVSWTASSCKSCYVALERRFNAIPAVAQTDFTQNSAYLRWKPNYPYDDRLVRTPVAWSGLKIREIRVKTRGTILHDEKEIFLLSIGDNTLFPLSSPTQNSMRSTLDTATKERLLQAEANFELVTVEGIVKPHRPPAQLQIENIEYAESEKRESIS